MVTSGTETLLTAMSAYNCSCHLTVVKTGIEESMRVMVKVQSMMMA